MNYQDLVERAAKPRSLQHELALDEAVGKRGTPSLPKLKFMEGLGPEDPRFEPQSGSNAEAGGLNLPDDWRHVVRCCNVETTEV